MAKLNIQMMGSLACALAISGCSSAAEMQAAGGDASPAATVPAQDAAAHQPTVARAREALREAGAADAQDARLISVDPAQWNDSSLGCPRPRTSYLQVITSGHVVRFATATGPKEVHVAGDAAVVCDQQPIGSPKRPYYPVRAAALESVVTRARQDLAAKLGKPLDDVKLINALPFTWEDGTFRCGGSAANDPARISGYKLRLMSGTESYVYHTDSKSVFACPPIETE